MSHVKTEKIFGIGCLILAIISHLIMVALFMLVFRLIAVPLTDYPYYFGVLCHNSHAEVSANKQGFVLKDENGQPLSCKKVRIEEESWCIESPCPDFSVIRRQKTAEDGTLVVPKKIFTDKMWSHIDREEVSNDEKAFLFHVKGNYNTTTTFKEIIDRNLLVLKLTKRSEEDCANPRWRKNFCDGF